MKNAVFIMLTFLICNHVSYGQLHPFPRNTDYLCGFKPSTISSTETERTYNSFKDLLVTECNDMYRVKTVNAADTYVEGMGFGMLAAAYYGDKELFDGLYDFYKSKRTANANNMMAWNVTCSDINDPGSATDGDVDVAFSLVIAFNQWGGDYLDEAREVIDVIKNSVMITCDDLLALAPGYSLQAGPDGMWGGCDLMDIMYHTPAFFRVFAEVTGDTTWNKLADDTYIMLNNSANSTTGLVPDWQSVDGNPGGDPPSRVEHFGYDACRVPWRIALDYLWNGNEQARTWCTKVSGWANGVGAANILDGYNLDGTPYSTAQYHNNSFVGGFAVSAMCNSQTIADNFGAEMNSSALKSDTYWFNLCTRTVYLFAITGNFWKPDYVTDISKPENNPEILIYPNPAGEYLIINTNEKAKLEIYNIYGQLMFREQLSENLNTVPLGRLSPGYYILKISNNNGSHSESIWIK